MHLFGRVTAAATSSRGAAAASVAHQFAVHLVAIEEGVADMVAADASAADSERVMEAGTFTLHPPQRLRRPPQTSSASSIFHRNQLIADRINTMAIPHQSKAF